MQTIINFFKRLLGMRRRNKIILGLVILVVLFLVFRGRQKPVELKYASVQRNNIYSQVSASGILNGKKSVSLHFNSAGKLNYLAVGNGDIVSKGQVIATLDNTQQSVALQQALNNRRNTQANVDYIHDTVKDHSGDETFSQKATRTTAEVANDNAYDSVRSAQRALQDTIIYSPISGIIVNQGSITVGQNVTPNDLIGQVVDFSEKAFDATIDESDIGQIQIGQNAKVTLNAYGDTEFNGKVTEIKPTTVTDSTGAITVTVKIQIDDSRITNIYGLNGNANIITRAKENVLIIPQDALIDDSHVYIKDSKGKPEKREIQTGIKSDTDVEILSGLNEGDQVVTNPQAVTNK